MLILNASIMVQIGTRPRILKLNKTNREREREREAVIMIRIVIHESTLCKF